MQNINETTYEDIIEFEEDETSINYSGRVVQAVELPDNLKHIIGKSRGKPAPGDRIPVDTPLTDSQRPFYPNEVIKNLESTGLFDWNLFGYATAVRHSDGTLELVDAQHRFSKVKTILPNVTEVPAHIIDTDDPEYVATLFWKLNATRHVTREERVWAEVVARNPEALKVKEALELCDLAIGRVNQGLKADGTPRPQIKVANFEKCLKFGLTHTIRASYLIQKYYPKAKKGFDQQLSGLTRLLSLKSFNSLSNSRLVNGQRFEQWFAGLPQNLSIGDLKFKQYHNTSNWYNGTAYGMAKKFRRWQSVNGYPLIGLTEITDIYKKGIKSTAMDDDE
jgi:hypothetical protein